MLEIKKRSQKFTPYLVQNDVVLYSELYCKKWENVGDINSWGFPKLNDWDELPDAKRTEFCGRASEKL